ncbi:hypothetical protein CTAYLR_009579 [Chrysophaeum taylorii]|uniref:Amino acid transporter transmembrane domain-containing protein n=1 Tax=Chrysophaeum taylorii TaxID=2483200 RepID=A0AAD7UQC7_9STRA|nr:hypothetical protein CTAYLR_009579 [Chrysophaeum taylorii]
MSSTKEESDGLIKHEAEAGTSVWSSGIALAKAINGAGCFVMPFAAQKAGWGGYMLCLSVCVGVGAFSLENLFDLKRLKGAQSYGELARLTLESPAAGGVARALVGLCTLGVIAAYVAFIATTIATGFGTSRRWHAVLAAGCVVLPTTFLGRVHEIASGAKIGISAVLLGSIVVVVSGLATTSVAAPHNIPPPFTSLSGFNQCFGPVAFLYCVHGNVFPLENAMADPTKFGQVGRIIFAVTGLLNLAFGIAAAALYPNVTSVVVNDIRHPFPRILAQICVCGDLISSYPIIFTAAVQNIDTPTDKHNEVIAFSRTRALIFVASVLIALDESFVAIVGIVGGFGQAVLAFVFPPLMVAAATGRSLSTFSAIIQGSIFVLGVVLVFSSTVADVATIIADHRSPRGN